jgi:hypothetical protein
MKEILDDSFSLRRETLIRPAGRLRQQDWTHKKSHDAALWLQKKMH